MPRQVDHVERRRELGEAVWRVIRDQGIERVSVRTVAAEARTSPGALRHYFPTQDDLAAFSLQLIVDSASARVTGVLAGHSGRDAAVLVLEQFLPLDEQRRLELAVYLAFVGRDPTETALRAIRDDIFTASRQGVLVALELLRHDAALHPDRDLGVEADALYPFLDGLALHGVLWPTRYRPARLRRLLRARLAELAAPPTAPGAVSGTRGRANAAATTRPAP